MDTAGSEVTAIADGVITFANPINYPGFVIIVQHTLLDGQTIYSVYAHLDSPLEVSTGQVVSRGQRLGTVLHQAYDGRYPTYHDPYDSHLHFEIRHFADGSQVPCGSSAPGPGYSYPNHPDNVPSLSNGYTDPTNFL